MRSLKLLYLIFYLLFTLHSVDLYSLDRDYYYLGFTIHEDQEAECYDDDGYEYYLYASNEVCKNCNLLTKCYVNELDVSCIPNLKNSQTNNWPNIVGCTYCQSNKTFYSGYLHFLYRNNFLFLKRQIDYTQKYPNVQAYWPETSIKAERISDYTIRSLKNLFSITDLRKVWLDEKLLSDFMISSPCFSFSEYERDYVYKGLVSSAFRFTDYYIIFRDLIDYSKNHFSEFEIEKIQIILDVILDDLAVQFIDLYEESILQHPTEEIIQELNFINRLYCMNLMKSSQQKLTPYLYKSKLYSDFNKVNTVKSCFDNQLDGGELFTNTNIIQPEWFMSEYYLLNGTIYNDLMLHEYAINFLNDAIKINPSEINAYVERAHAYFELNCVDLAIKDYEKVKELQDCLPPYKNNTIKTNFSIGRKNVLDSFCGELNVGDPLLAKGGLDYTSGLCVGITRGAGDSLVEFLPSTLSCCRGILHGLWAFVCAPVEVSEDVISSSYELFEYLKTHTTQESLEVAVPELKILCQNWDTFSEYSIGLQAGYIIGKYGMDVLTPGAAISGVKKIRNLRRANSMFTIECCLASQTKKNVLLGQGLKHVAARQAVQDFVKIGRVVPRNANVMPHVMQKKHAWDKLIKLTGNQKEDFISVIKILEENSVLGKEFLKDSFHVPMNDPKTPLRRLRFEKKIRGEILESIFIKNIETEEVYLIDAWIRVK